MQLQTEVSLNVKGIPITRAVRITYDLHTTCLPAQIPNITRTEIRWSEPGERNRDGSWRDAEWLWDILTYSQSRALDHEMIANWNAVHGLAVRRTA